MKTLAEHAEGMFPGAEFAGSGADSRADRQAYDFGSSSFVVLWKGAEQINADIFILEADASMLECAKSYALKHNIDVKVIWGE